MKDWMLLLPILIPVSGALLVFLMPKDSRALQRVLAMLFSAAALGMTIILYGRQMAFNLAWAGFGIDFNLKLDSFSSFIILVAAFTFLTVLYSVIYMDKNRRERLFYGFTLLTSAFVSGAMLADNLVVMLFFWEGLLGLLFGMIMVNGNKASSTAIKALIINGTADLCLIFGVGITFWQAGSLDMGAINLPLKDFWPSLAYILMMIGAIAKAGSMPFHSWIPDAATDAPLPFLAFIPAALDKILGIYLLARLNLSIFLMLPGSNLSLAVMVIGACTIILAVMMALIQKDYKKLLGYHAISQVGYMILGIGTALPIGIVGGIFHMINNALYKSCLFFTAGSVEREVGTTDLTQLSGLGRQMPLTFTCFLIAAAAIAGVPPLNGFYSKELVFDAALQSNVVFFIIAAAGAFCTAASFLKLGHTVYFGKPSKLTSQASESPWPMVLPMIVLAGTCVLFGVYNTLPLQYMIEPVLGGLVEQSFSGLLPHNWILAGISVGVLLLAVANHAFGVRRTGKAIGAVDHIHNAPVLKSLYASAEAGSFDPYKLSGSVVDTFAVIMDYLDKGIDWVVSRMSTGLALLAGRGLDRIHTGRHWMYVLWVLAGVVVVTVIFIFGGGGLI